MYKYHPLSQTTAVRIPYWIKILLQLPHYSGYSPLFYSAEEGGGWYISTKGYGVMSRETVFFIITDMITTDLIMDYLRLVYCSSNS